MVYQWLALIANLVFTYFQQTINYETYLATYLHTLHNKLSLYSNY